MEKYSTQFDSRNLFIQNDSAIISWLEANKKDILPFCQKLNKKNNISLIVEKKICELLVKDHIKYKKEIMDSPVLYYKSIDDDNKRPIIKEDYFFHFFKLFSTHYRETFKDLDFELLDNIAKKNLECHYEMNRKYSSQDVGTKIEYRELNFIQSIYKHYCQINSFEALNFYLDFKNTSVDSWNFFAPLEPIFSNLTLKQQEIFTVVALKELQIDHEDEHGNILNYKSFIYSYKDVLNSLLSVPTETLLKFKSSFQIHADIEQEVEKFFLHKKLDFELLDNKSSIKKLKI